MIISARMSGLGRTSVKERSLNVKSFSLYIMHNTLVNAFKKDFFGPDLKKMWQMYSLFL